MSEKSITWQQAGLVRRAKMSKSQIPVNSSTARAGKHPRTAIFSVAGVGRLTLERYGRP